MHKIIFFELNEVPLKIIEYYISIRKNSWLAKNYTRLKKYTTVTENEGHISPWNTWPTVHRGVASNTHFITDFNQDLTEVDGEFPPIWKLLSNNGIRTGIFGSLHTHPVPKELGQYDFFVPDVFAPNHECFPKEVERFQKLNLRLSRESIRNVDSKIPFGDLWGFLGKIGTLGFTGDTVFQVGKQLTAEKIQSWKAVRRRTFQAILSFDVFYKLLRTKKPDFVTFFTNHVASSMHRYWAAVFPDEYDEMKYDEKWINRYSDEIIFTMDAADKMLRKLAGFVDRNKGYKLVVSSSMGQEAVECEPIETELYISEPSKFMKMLGVANASSYEVMPAMAPQFNYKIEGSMCDAFEEQLRELKINGKALDYRRKDEFFSIDCSRSNLQDITILVGDKSVIYEESGFENVVITDRSSATAYHIPEGILFSYHPSNKEEEEVVKELPTCDILPILLNNFGISKAPYMNDTDFKNL